MVKAVIFDMDGVLADDEAQDFLAWKDIFAEYNQILTRKKYASFLGLRGQEILSQYLNSSIGPDETARIIEKKEDYFIKESKKNKLKSPAGLHELLKMLQANKIKIGVGTSAPKSKTRFILKEIGVENFMSVVIMAEDVKAGKPNPEVYLKVAEKLNVLPQECVVFEDAPNGIKAAKNAGMKCVAITTTHNKKELSEADMVVNTFKGLALKKIKKRKLLTAVYRI